MSHVNRHISFIYIYIYILAGRFLPSKYCVWPQLNQSVLTEKNAGYSMYSIHKGFNTGKGRRLASMITGITRKAKLRTTFCPEFQLFSNKAHGSQWVTPRTSGGTQQPSQSEASCRQSSRYIWKLLPTLHLFRGFNHNSRRLPRPFLFFPKAHKFPSHFQTLTWNRERRLSEPVVSTSLWVRQWTYHLQCNTGDLRVMSRC